MTILVTGATGTVGEQVVAQLVKRHADVRAFVRDPRRAKLPEGVAVVRGDLLDIESIRSGLEGVSTLFLLNAVVPDELTQAMVTLNLAREAGIRRIVYFSVLHNDVYVNVPHFAAKHAMERMIVQMGLNATILRPGYFIDNDLRLKEAILGQGVYPQPIGNSGIEMVEARDIGEVAALELLRREQAAEPLPLERISVIGPEAMTGASVAAVWSDVLGRPVTYGGDDTVVFERMVSGYAPAWRAYDNRYMMEHFQNDGLLAQPGDADRLARLLGRPLRSYRDFAVETAAEWTKGAN